MTTSENSIGICLSELSKKRDVLADPSWAFSPEPAKMISSDFFPRRLLRDCSPIAHLIASATFDFPLPFGPTMAVIPQCFPFFTKLQDGKKSKTVLVANDLQPVSSILFKYIFVFLPSFRLE